MEINWNKEICKIGVRSWNIKNVNKKGQKNKNGKMKNRLLVKYFWYIYIPCPEQICGLSSLSSRIKIPNTIQIWKFRNGLTIDFNTLRPISMIYDNKLTMPQRI